MKKALNQRFKTTTTTTLIAVQYISRQLPGTISGVEPATDPL